MRYFSLYRREILLNFLTEIIAEVIDGHGTRLRRVAAREIVKLQERFHNANNGRDVSLSAIGLFDLKYRLADLDPPAYFSEQLRGESEPYSADEIPFPALVQLVRMEDRLLFWGWLPEQVRALGLSIHPGEELTYDLTGEFIIIKDRDGKLRPFYRLS
jgi:hypothetical protein